MTISFSFRILLRMIASVAALLALAACSDEPGKNPVAKAPKANPDEIVLAADSPKKAYIETRELTLTSRPLLEPLVGKIVLNENFTSRISSPLSGRVISEPLALGSAVRTGQTLLELDSPDFAAAQADYAKAQADLALARHDYQRQRELYEGKAVPLKDYEKAQDVLIQSQSEVRRTRERLRNLHVNPLKNNRYFALAAPINGIILERHLNYGMEVRPDLAEPLYVISDIHSLSLLMEIFEVNLAKIKLGQHVLLTVPAYPDQRFPATVEYIDQELDETTRTILVRCRLPNPDGRLLPGMYATVDVQSAPDDKAIVIPLTAVFTEDAADYVFVEKAPNRYQRRQVRLGLRLRERAVVESGLAPGEKLVSKGALMLRTEEAVEEHTGP